MSATASPRDRTVAPTRHLTDPVAGVVARTRPRQVARVLVESAAIAVAALLILVVLGRLAGRDITRPLNYSGDANFYGMLAKGLLEHGSALRNPSLGFPFGQQLYDLPQGGENLQVAQLWSIVHLTGSWPLAVNAVYLLGFPAAALSAYWVSRRLGVARGGAAVVAFAFTFLPYHFTRGTSHLFLSGYWVVPLGVLLCLRVAGVGGAWSPRADDERPWWRRVGGRQALAAVAIAVVIGSSSTYYAAFTAALLVVVAAVVAVARRDAVVFVLGAILALLVVLTVFVDNAPALLFWRDHGVNRATLRAEQSLQVYGLRVTRLVLPTEDHRFGPLRYLGERGATGAAIPSEAGGALGLLGVAGFAGALFEVLRRSFAGDRPVRRRDGPEHGVEGEVDGREQQRSTELDIDADRDDDRSDAVLRSGLGGLVVVALLLGLIGGFGFLVGVAGFTFIRAWGRISIFIAFASLLVVGVWVGRLDRRLRRAGRPLLAFACVAVLVAVAVLDGTPSRPFTPAAAVTPSFESDARLVSHMESYFAPGTPVFQLPVHRFPEAGPRFGMQDYDPLRGYLHSRTLRWSYGGMKGRRWEWQERVARLPVAREVDAIVAVGFRALWVDREGWQDRGAAMGAAVRAELGPPVLTSAGGRFDVWDLRERARRLEARLGRAGVAELAKEVLRG